MHLQLKLGVASVLDQLGILGLLRRSRTLGGVVLTFHRVLEDEELARCYEPHIALRATSFAELLLLLEHEFQVTPLEELLAAPAARRRDRPRVALTFDDGWEDTCSVAGPLLAQHGMPATVFLCPSLIDGGQAAMLPEERFARVWAAAARQQRLPHLVRDLETWRVGDGHSQQLHAWGRRLKRLPLQVKLMMLGHLEEVYQPSLPEKRHFVTWDQVRSMQSLGFTFGSHTVCHASLDAEEAPMMLAELAGSREAIEQETGAPCTTLAYPNGAYNDAVMRAVQVTGYRHALTTDRGFVQPGSDALAIPRLCMGDPVLESATGALHHARTRLYMQQIVLRRGSSRASRRLVDQPGVQPPGRGKPAPGVAETAAERVAPQPPPTSPHLSPRR